MQKILLQYLVSFKNYVNLNLKVHIFLTKKLIKLRFRVLG